MDYPTAKYTKLFDLVRRIRALQRDERKYRGLVPKSDKDRLRALERELDALIISEVKEQQGKQKSIF